MRHLMITAALALSAAGLAGCDELGLNAPARTASASASQCVPAPVVTCAAKGKVQAQGKPVAVATTRGQSHAVHAGAGAPRVAVAARHWRHEQTEGGHERYARVEHYGYVDGGQTREDAYASGATMRASRASVTSETRYSERRESSESGSAYAESSGSMSGGSYEGSGYGYRSGGHQGRLVIRDSHGRAQGWTWRTAGRDERGYLTWPGKTPD